MLAPHVVKILKELGYNEIQTLVKIESPESLEKLSKTLFVNVKFIKPCRRKKRLLGSSCWKQPSYFKFLSGEESSLESIKTFCSALLEKMPLIYLYPNTSEQNPWFSMNKVQYRLDVLLVLIFHTTAVRRTKKLWKS
jgi:hypothetical protein